MASAVKWAPRGADTEGVQKRVRLLKQMVDESLYVVDEMAVANAVIARAMVRQAVAAPELRGERREVPIRSFRRTRSVRSFRITTGAPDVGHHR
jgi:hypothetical protein